MTRKSKARYNLNRTYKVSQTVKALRRALALGLATAVVAPAAQAGTCIDVINDVFCFGDFGDTTVDSWGALSVYDTFDPATVEFDGTIYTDNNRGIVAWNFDDMAFANDGAVILNDSNNTDSWSSVGVYAESFQGDVAFDNTGVIAVVRDNGDWGQTAVSAARVEAAQDITITNSGFIASENDGGFTAGLQAVSYGGGTINITNTVTGDFAAEANDYGDAVALGVYSSGGTVNISTDGDVGAASRDQAFGIRVFSGDTTITAGSTSEINVRGFDAYGIYVETGNNTVDISNAGHIETDAFDDAYGIRVLSPVNGDVTVSNSGSIDSYAATDWAAGIAVYAGGGNVSVTNSQYGTILSDGNDDSAGISVRSYTGDISVRNDGAIYSTSETALGIATFGKYNNTVQISNSGSIEAYAQVGGSTSAAGVYALGFNNDTTVINSGEIVAAGGNMYNAGVVVFAAGTDDYGTVTVVNSGTIDAISDNYFGGNSGAGDSFGVYVLANGNVTVENTGSYVYGPAVISAYSEFGDVAAGVLAISSNGDVSVTNSNKYSYIGAFAGANVFNNGNPYSTSFGIYAEASDGSVSVNNAGVVLAYNSSSNGYGNIAGGSAIGIRANAYESDSLAPLAAYMSDGDITVSNTGLVLAISESDNASGVQASSNYGDITISNAGSSKYSPGLIYAVAEEGYAAGIQAITGGDGSITISNSGGYVIADGYSGAVGIAASTDSGDIVVTNAESDGGYSGVIAAFADSSGYSGNAAGVSAYSYYGNMGIYNSGVVVADSSYGSAAGIRATTGDHSNGAIYVANTGNVDAYGYSGTFGISANTYTGAITINNTVDDNGNSGVIVAVNRGEGYAYGIDANINDNYSSANINIINGYGALIITQAAFAGEVSDAYGIRAFNAGYGDILVNNAGVIGAQAYDDAYAIWAYAGGDGNISITNTETGSLYAESVTDDAYGVYAYAHGNGSIGVTNSGSISAISSGSGDNASGIYAYADGDGNVTVSNSGSILAQTSGDYGDAFGVYAYANGDGYVSVTNSGTIVATATGDYSDAYGIYAGTENEGDINVVNTGSIIASSAGYDSNAIGIYAYSDDGSYISVTNGQYGSITVNSSGAFSFAAGIEVENDDSDNYSSIVSITNNGTVTVGTTGFGSNANGIWTHGGGTHDADVYITNNGSFDVTTTGLYADAWGIEVDDIRGDTLVHVLNSGDVTVAASYGYAFGIQTETFGFETETQITNYGGNLTVSTGGNSLAIGIGAYAYGAGYGDITVYNTAGGNVDVSSTYGSAVGIGVYAEMSQSVIGSDVGGSIVVINAGDITVQGYDSADGIAVTVDAGASYQQYMGYQCFNTYGCNGLNGFVGLYGYVVTQYGQYVTGEGSMPVIVTNSGSIDVASNYSNAEGITVDMGTGSYGETAWVTNSGSIDVVTENGFTALGIHVDNQWGDINVSNTASGTIDVANESGLYYGGYYGYYGGGYAVGIRTYGEFANTTISNAGDITVGNSPWRSNGIRADNKYGDVTVTNLAGGSISVDTSGLDAYGIEVDNKYGDVTVSNAGSITVSTGYWNSKGIEVENDHGDTVISTAVGSSITVTGDGYQVSGGILGYSQSGDITVTNAGGLTVTADYFATGIHLYSDYGDVSVTNSGAVSVSSASGNAEGIYAETGDGTSSVTNSAAITVTAANYAVGIYAYANGGDASVTNSAAGHVSVTGDSATGISVQSNSYGYDVTLNNAGKITVVGNDGDAYGAYVETDGYGTLNITSSGDITVTSSGHDTYAVGLYAQHEDYGDVNVTSSSKITVTNNSDYGDAVGIRAMSEDGSAITVTNSGTILASTNNAYGFSVGIYTENFNGSSTTITNSGSVKATGDYAYAIYHYGTDVDIVNSTNGKIFGVIATDYGNDSFTNSGKWYATQGVNYVSDFNEGDDAIVNSSTGKIYMEDSVIDLGYAEGSTNSFLNNGKLYANGDANYIYMGGNGSVFTNNGNSIHMEDGAANDSLFIIGDFAGTGKIVVDANGTSMMADRLYIEGDVVSNTANVIDVYLDQNPSLQDMVDGELIDIVYVSGTSAAANFNLGIVDVEDDLLYTVDYELVKQINYSGTNDLFSLGFEISGLTPTGVAMSSIAPAVQNLWRLGVGTVFQREGTKRDYHGGGSANSLMNAGFKNATGGNAQVADYQGAAGLWLRAFTENGGLNPDGGRDNFGLGGEHGFDMKNSGVEFGAGYAFNSQWTAGLLGGVSDGSLKPSIGGRTTIDAKTIGGYVTYTPGNGFYADLSYRSMDFDGNGNGGGQDFSFDGKADGFSLEMGYGIKTSSGLIVEPQFQYSSMDVNLDNVDYNQGGFDLTDGKSSQTRLGVSLRKTLDTGNGNSWTPYASLSYVNESNASNDYVIGGVLTGNVDTSGNSTLFEGGATAKYGNMLFSGGLNWKDGGAYESMFGGQVSVRFTW